MPAMLRRVSHSGPSGQISRHLVGTSSPSPRLRRAEPPPLPIATSARGLRPRLASLAEGPLSISEPARVSSCATRRVIAGWTHWRKGEARERSERGGLNPPPSVPEVPEAGEDHREAEAIGGGDDVGVLHAATRLRDGGDAMLGGRLDAVREREERIGREHAAGGLIPCLLTCNLHRNHARHLACADAHRALGLREDDGVRLHVLADAPSEVEALHL